MNDNKGKEYLRSLVQASTKNCKIVYESDILPKLVEHANKGLSRAHLSYETVRLRCEKHHCTVDKLYDYMREIGLNVSLNDDKFHPSITIEW